MLSRSMRVSAMAPPEENVGAPITPESKGKAAGGGETSGGRGPGGLLALLVRLLWRVVPYGQVGPLPGAGHASQQLAHTPTTAPVSVGQWAESFLVLHLIVTPSLFGTQQVTAVDPLPHVDFAAHFLTALLQLFGRGRVGSVVRVWAT